MTQNPTTFHGQASIHSDAVVRNLMAKTGLDDYLNREGVTEVLINREREVFWKPRPVLSGLKTTG